MKLSVWICGFALTLSALTYGCSGSELKKNSENPEHVTGCPDRPNCVSSEAQDPRHAIEPFKIKGDIALTWDAVREVVGSLPRTKVVKATDRYLHAECKSRFFGFIDDLELELNPEAGTIAIRSASRVGYFDLGVNRRRVETLRQRLTQDRIIN
jgi:uncharacterized protein (DUF1499 family)